MFRDLPGTYIRYFGHLYSLAAVSGSTYVREAKSDPQHHSTCPTGRARQWPRLLGVPSSTRMEDPDSCSISLLSVATGTEGSASIFSIRAAYHSADFEFPTLFSFCLFLLFNASTRVSTTSVNFGLILRAPTACSSYVLPDTLN